MLNEMSGHSANQNTVAQRLCGIRVKKKMTVFIEGAVYAGLSFQSSIQYTS